MTPRRITALMLGLMIAGPFAQVHAQITPVAPNSQVRLDARRTLGTAHTFRNLTVLPIYDPAARSTNTYLTLDEGLQAKTVSVQEAKDGGAVNTLYVTNRSDKPLYLMAGEVVLGGQQDRCLGQDRLVEAGAKRVPITVFCVEHGRWNGRADFDVSAPTVASADIRLGAQESNFYADRETAHVAGTLNQANAAVEERVARVSPGTPALATGSGRVSNGQQQVWDKVATKNARFKTKSATDTYRNTLTMAGGDAKQNIPAYVRVLENSLGHNPHLVGAVACVNGKVVALDSFSDPALFRKLWPKLLRGYAADAVENAPAKEQKSQNITMAQIKAFYAAATDAKTTAENRSTASTTLRLTSKEATTYRLVPAQSAAGGGVASPLHETVLHK
jgi:hypothetical protein